MRLRLPYERDSLQGLRRGVREGFAEIERGKYEEYDMRTSHSLAKEIKAPVRRKLAAMAKTG
jgi:hypothetical protein